MLNSNSFKLRNGDSVWLQDDVFISMYFGVGLMVVNFDCVDGSGNLLDFFCLMYYSGVNGFVVDCGSVGGYSDVFFGVIGDSVYFQFYGGGVVFIMQR